MEQVKEIIRLALIEDAGDGDHTSLACIPDEAEGRAQLIVKESGTLAGVDVARLVFEMVDNNIVFTGFMHDGMKILPGDVVFEVSGNVQSLLKAERLALNILQRMSGIATKAAEYVSLIKGTKARILDTRKTTPNMRILEKMAVQAGGGYNHRMGLYDMILIKDNHVDFCGGIKKAISAVNDYLHNRGMKLPIVIEVRNFEELNQVMETGDVDRIMLDNFTLGDLKRAVELIGGKFETEASGGITEITIRQVALSGVDCISVGALTHNIKSLDMSLKAI